MNGIPHGFNTDFFDTVEDLHVDPPDALETSMEGMVEGGHMDMGVMVVREPTQTASITFTVTEASIGEWELGFFEKELTGTTA